MADIHKALFNCILDPQVMPSAPYIFYRRVLEYNVEQLFLSIRFVGAFLVARGHKDFYKKSIFDPQGVSS